MIPAAGIMRLDAAVAAVSSELDGNFTLKVEQRTALVDRVKDVLALPPTGFGRHTVSPPCTNRRPLVVTNLPYWQ